MPGLDDPKDMLSYEDVLAVLLQELENEERLINECFTIEKELIQLKIINETLEIKSRSKVNNSNLTKRVQYLSDRNARLEKQLKIWQDKYNAVQKNPIGKIVLKIWNIVSSKTSTDGQV